MFVKDHQAVKTIVFGDVAGGDGITSADPTEGVLRGAFHRFAKWAAAVTLNHLVNVAVVPSLHRSARAQIVE